MLWLFSLYNVLVFLESVVASFPSACYSLAMCTCHAFCWRCGHVSVRSCTRWLVDRTWLLLWPSWVLQLPLQPGRAPWVCPTVCLGSPTRGLLPGCRVPVSLGSLLERGCAESLTGQKADFSSVSVFCLCWHLSSALREMGSGAHVPSRLGGRGPW